MFWMWNTSRGGGWVALSGIMFTLTAIAIIMLGLPTGRSTAFVVPLVFFGLPVLAIFARRLSPSQARPAAARASDAGEKPKRGESLGELMSILSDDDIDDLRRRVKQRLIEQVESSDAEQLETFDDLLAETKAKRR